MSDNEFNIVKVSPAEAAPPRALRQQDASTGLLFQSGSAQNTPNDGTVSLRGTVNTVEELRRASDESTNGDNINPQGPRHSPTQSDGMEVDGFEDSIFIFPNGHALESENEEMIDLSMVPRSTTPSDVDMQDLSMEFSCLFAEPSLNETISALESMKFESGSHPVPAQLSRTGLAEAANVGNVSTLNPSASNTSGNNSKPNPIVDLEEPMEFSDAEKPISPSAATTIDDDVDMSDGSDAPRAFESLKKPVADSIEADLSRDSLVERPLQERSEAESSLPSSLDKATNAVNSLVLPSVVGTESVGGDSTSFVPQKECLFTADPKPKKEPTPKRGTTNNEDEPPKKRSKIDDDKTSEASSITDYDEQESSFDETPDNVNSPVLPSVAGTGPVAVYSTVVSQPTEFSFTAEPEPKVDDIAKRGPTYNMTEPPKKCSKLVEEEGCSIKDSDEHGSIPDETNNDATNQMPRTREVILKREGDHDSKSEPPKKIRKMAKSDFLFDYETAEAEISDDEMNAAHVSNSLQGDSSAEEDDVAESEGADSSVAENANGGISQEEDKKSVNEDSTDASHGSNAEDSGNTVSEDSDNVPASLNADPVNDAATIPEEESEPEALNELIDEANNDAISDENEQQGSISGNESGATLEADDEMENAVSDVEEDQQASISGQSTASTSSSSVIRRAYAGFNGTDALELEEAKRREEAYPSDDDIQVEEPVRKAVPKLITTDDNASSSEEGNDVESDREPSPVPSVRSPSPALSTTSNAIADGLEDTVDDFDLIQWLQELLDANFSDEYDRESTASPAPVQPDFNEVPPLNAEIDDEPTEYNNGDAELVTPVQSEPDYDIAPMDDLSEPMETDEASDADISDIESEPSEDESDDDEVPMEVENVPAPKSRRDIDPWKVVEPVESFCNVQLPAPNEVIVCQMYCQQFGPLTPASLTKEVKGKSFIAGLYNGKLVMQGSFEGVPLTSALLAEAAIRPQMVYNDPTDPLKDVVTGDDHIVMLGESGRIYMLGRADEGQLGREPSRHRYLTPSPLNMRVRKFIHEENGKPKMTPEVFFDRIEADGNLTKAWSKEGHRYQCGTSRDGRFCSSVLRRRPARNVQQ